MKNDWNEIKRARKPAGRGWANTISEWIAVAIVAAVCYCWWMLIWRP